MKQSETVLKQIFVSSFVFVAQGTVTTTMASRYVMLWHMLCYFMLYYDNVTRAIASYGSYFDDRPLSWVNFFLFSIE